MDSYISMYFGYLVDYLEKLSILIINKYCLKGEVDSWLNVYGLEVLFRWMENLCRIL